MHNSAFKSMSDSLYESFNAIKESPLDLNKVLEHIALLTSTVDTLTVTVSSLLEIIGDYDDGK